MASILRETIHAPRLGGVSHFVHEYDRARFLQVAESAWVDLLHRLEHPIQTRQAKTRRSVTVLGFARYVASREDGTLSLLQPKASSHPQRWRKVQFPFSVDLPFKPTEGLFEECLARWRSALVSYAISDAACCDLWRRLVRAFRRAALRSANWKLLRHQVRAALDLDSETLDMARRARVNAHHTEVTDRQYNFVARNLESLRQLRDDNPNLLWLAGLAFDEGKTIRSGEGGLISALRQRILGEFKLPPVAWRYLANGHRRDFRVVIDWLGAHGSPAGRWLELRDWLRVLVALEPEHPIPLPVQRIFLHDQYVVKDEGKNLWFRNTKLPIEIGRSLILEAERHLASGTLRAFVEGELADVLSWAGAVKPSFDSNQLKAGWRHFVRRATDWKHDRKLQEASGTVRWDSLVGSHDYGHWKVEAVTDVWQLHQVALHSRNCADNYLPDCVSGNVRLFFVLSSQGRQLGTIGLVRRGRVWETLDVRGFANAQPGDEMKKLAAILAERYGVLWQTLLPLADQRGVESVSLQPRSEYGVDSSDVDGGEVDEYPFADEDARACPICGDQEFDCAHLVATVDHFNGGICGGELYESESALIGKLWALIVECASEGRRFTGSGWEFDRILEAVKREYRLDHEPDDIEANHIDEVRTAFYNVLSSLPDVIDTYWEFDGGMPGCSTCGRDYWAPDPQSVLEDLKDILLDNEARDGRKVA